MVSGLRGGTASQPQVPIDFVPEVHDSLWRSFKEEWLRTPNLWRRLADTPVPMRFVAAGDDIRPSWPVEQLARLVPDGRFRTLPSVGHDFWATAPELWVSACTAECAALLDVRQAGASLTLDSARADGRGGHLEG